MHRGRTERRAAIASAAAAVLVVLGMASSGARHRAELAWQKDPRSLQASLLNTPPAAHKHKRLHDEVFAAMRRAASNVAEQQRPREGVASQVVAAVAALQTDDQFAAADARALARERRSVPKQVMLHGQVKKATAQGPHASPTVQSLNVPHAKSLKFPYDASAYGADGGSSGYRALPSGSTTPEQASAQWEYPGFACYDPMGCDPPDDPDETKAEAIAEAIADDPSYYGDDGVDDEGGGSPWHKGTPYRGTYMHATFPYENEPTGFFAGFHTVENSGLSVGMGKHRDVNSYYYPDAVRVTTGDWHFKNYDLDGSYMVPEVDAFGEYNGTLPVLNPVTGREQYTIPGNHSGPDPAEFSGVGSGMLWANRTREGGGDSGKPAYTGNYFPFASN
jgi:hypothetical protein